MRKFCLTHFCISLQQNKYSVLTSGRKDCPCNQSAVSASQRQEIVIFRFNSHCRHLKVFYAFSTSHFPIVQISGVQPDRLHSAQVKRYINYTDSIRNSRAVPQRVSSAISILPPTAHLGARHQRLMLNCEPAQHMLPPIYPLSLMRRLSTAFNGYFLARLQEIRLYTMSIARPQSLQLSKIMSSPQTLLLSHHAHE